MAAVLAKKISVVIALDRRTLCHRKLISALAEQSVSLAEHEVIVVDGEPTPGINETLAAEREAVERTGLRFFSIGQTSRAAARNFGVQQSSGDLVLFLADDFVPEPQLIKAHLRFHETHPQAHLIGLGPAFFPEHLRRDPFTRWLEDSGALFGVSFMRPDPAAIRSFFYGANTSLKRSLLERSGLFDEIFPFHTTEDYELGLRLAALGAETVYLPEARVSHEHEHVITLAERKRAMWETGYSVALLERRYPDRPKLAAQYPYPPAMYSLSALVWRLLSCVSRYAAHRERFWRHALADAMLCGYRAGQVTGELPA